MTSHRWWGEWRPPLHGGASEPSLQSGESELLRVALVCPYSFSHSGGVQSHVVGLSRWLVGQGHEVAILAPGRPVPGLLDGLPGGVFTSAGPGFPVPYNGSVARINFDPVAARVVRRWLDAVQPDVVHVHEPITPSISVLTLWQATVPLLATFHTATPKSRTMKLAGRLMRRTVDRIDGGIAVSSAARDVASRHIGVDPVVIGNGITFVWPPPVTTTRRWRGGARPRLTFLGRYDEPRKGFDVLLRALPRLRAVRPDLDVVVIGEGSRRFVPGVRFTGWVDDATRDALVGASDVYVAPHVGRESFGLVLLEAMALGTPVVASNLPAFAEVLADCDGRLGRSFPVGDASALADAVLDTLASPPSVGSVRRGVARAASFDWSIIGPQVLAQYESLLGRRSGAVSQPGVPERVA